MNKLYYFILTFLLSVTGYTQANIAISNFNAHSICTNQSNTYLTGDNGTAASLVKLDWNNNIIFSKAYSNIDKITEVIKIKNHLYLSGINQGKAIISKIDTIGNEIWTRETQNTVNIQYSFLYQTSDSLFLHYVNNNSVSVIALDTLGNQFWSVSIPTIEVHNIRSDLFKKNNYLYLAYTNSIDLSLAKIDEQGNIIWNKKYNYTGGFNPIFLNKTIVKDTTFILSGSLQSDPFILEMGLNGNVLVTKKIHKPSAASNYIESMIEYNNDYFLLGYLDDADTLVPFYTYYILKLDQNFNFVNQVKIGNHKILKRLYSKIIFDNNYFKLFFPYGNGNLNTTEMLFVQNIDVISCDTTHISSTIIDYYLDTITNSNTINPGENLISNNINTIITTNTITSLCPNLDISELNNTTISLFPNPNDGNFNFKISSDIYIKLICIYDVIGNVVFEKKDNFNFDKFLSINEKPGVYFLRVITEKNEVLNSKLIIE